MRTLIHFEDDLGLPSFVRMLHADGACETILEGLSKCDRWGPVPRGTGDVGHANLFLGWPRAPELGSDKVAEEEDGDGDGGAGSSLAPPGHAMSLLAGRKRGPSSSGSAGSLGRHTRQHSYLT